MSQTYTARFTEVHKLGDWSQPMTATAGQTWATDFESMQQYQRAVYLVFVGAMAAGATFNMLLAQAQDAAATNLKAIAGKQITELTQAGGGASSACIIEVRTEELDVDNGYTHVAAVSVTGVNNVTFSIVPLFFCANNPPVPITEWTEIID